MSRISFEEKIKFLLKLEKLQGFVGVSQIEEVAENPSEEEALAQKLKEDSVEINHFLKKERTYKTRSYLAKKESKFMLTTRIDESGESYLLNEKDEKELFETMTFARNNMLKFAFKSGEIREFMYKTAEKINDGTLKISTVANCEKDNKSIEIRKKNFLETIKKIQVTDEEKSVNLFFSLDINEKTKGVIYNKYAQTQDYKNEIADELYKWEQIYSNSKREIIEANIRLVFSIAKEYSVVHKGILDITDIIQEGNLGLIEAVESFDVSRGNRFSSWAVWYIRRQIWTAINSFKKMVYIPPKVSADLYRISIFEEKYRMQNGKSPTTAEIAKEFDIKEKHVVSLLSSDFDDINSNYESIIGDDDYYESIETAQKKDFNPFSAFGAVELKENIKKLLDKIGGREKGMVELYFGLIENSEPMNLTQIGSLYGLSSERVRQIIEKTMETMQNIDETGILKEWKKGE